MVHVFDASNASWGGCLPSASPPWPGPARAAATPPPAAPRSPGLLGIRFQNKYELLNTILLLKIPSSVEKMKMWCSFCVY